MSGLASQTRSRDFPGTIAAALDAEAWLAKESRALGLGADVEFAINLCLEELSSTPSSTAAPIAHRFPFAPSRTACGSNSSTTAPL